MLGGSDAADCALAQALTCLGMVLHAGGSGYTPLHYAARGGRLNAVHLLLKHGEMFTALSAGTRAMYPNVWAKPQGHVCAAPLLEHRERAKPGAKSSMIRRVVVMASHTPPKFP